MTCVNCGADVTTKYCPDCGQFSEIKKINAAQMWVDFQGRIYGFDGMFPRTMKDLTIRPGYASRAFIAGNRVRYYGPVGYFFLMITVVVLLAELLGVDLFAFMKTYASTTEFQSNSGTAQERMTAYIVQFIVDYMKIVFFVLIPLQAFAAKYLFFRKSSYNYLEHTVLPFYVMGHLYWVIMVNLILFRITGTVMPKLPVILISCAYYGYAYVDFIDDQSKVKTFFKGIGVYYLAQAIFALIAMAAVILTLYFNPEFVEMFRSGK